MFNVSIIVSYIYLMYSLMMRTCPGVSGGCDNHYQ